jgi:hypothetical protein
MNIRSRLALKIAWVMLGCCFIGSWALSTAVDNFYFLNGPRNPVPNLSEVVPYDTSKGVTIFVTPGQREFLRHLMWIQIFSTAFVLAVFVGARYLLRRGTN